MNNVSLVGRLTRAPEMRSTQSGRQVCSFAIAVDNPFQKDAQGNHTADFFNVSAWGNQADYAHRYLVKGQQVSVAGRIEIRQYDDRNGVSRTSVDVVAHDIRGLSKPERSRGDDGGGGHPGGRGGAGGGAWPSGPSDEDLPV